MRLSVRQDFRYCLELLLLFYFLFFLKDWSLLACFVSSTLTKEQVSKERSVFRPLEVVLCS